MLVLLCPGQGAQKPGFLAPWLEEESDRSWLKEAGDQVGIDLIHQGTVADAETVRDTRVAQPLIVAAGLLSLRRLLRARGLPVNTVSDIPGALAKAGKTVGVAGHSVGEITAAAAAGILSMSDALRFVRLRAEGMAAASAAPETSMAALLGAYDLPELLKKTGLEAANFNGSGQVVVAGAKANLQQLHRLAKEQDSGIRVVELAVAGAFHTKFMAVAVPPLRELEEQLKVADPQLQIWSNRDGTEVSSGRQFTSLLVEQVTSPVRWDRCQEAFGTQATALIELLPGGTLVGLAKRALPDIPRVALRSPDDIAAAAELLPSCL